VCIGSRLVGTGQAGEVWDRRFRRSCGALRVPAVEDVVELRHRIAAFNANGHAAVM
jgi:hypothetical protein